MSESLRFELLAIDRATAPLQAVQNKIAQTTAVANKSAGAFAKFDKKFAMGGLQQAGYQIGDFAVQLANGTNKMQAFGQQAPQILQIFGPIGAVVGAAVAVFAAFAVAAEKMSKTSNNAAAAVGSLKSKLELLGPAASMARFGVVSAEEAAILEQIDALNKQIIQAEIERSKVKLSTSMADRGKAQAALMELNNLKTQRGELQGQLDNYKKIVAINGQMLAIQNAQNALLIKKKIDEQATSSNMEVIVSDSVQLHKEISAAVTWQEQFNQRLKDGYRLYGFLRGQAQGLAADAAKAATQNLEYFKLGNLNKGLMGRAGAPGQGLKTDYGLPDEPPSTGGGGATDPLKTLREQLALEEQLLGKSEAQQRVIQALGVDWAKYGDATFNSLVEQINGMDELNKAAERQAEIASTIRSAFSDAFMSIVDGTKSVASAFKDMVKTIIMKLYEQLVVQQMVNAAMGVVGNIFPSLEPAIAGARAMGGPVTGGKPYLVGESGPEIVVPSRNSQVVPNSQIASGGVTVTQNISFGAGVSRAEIQAMLPKIVEATKAAVFDANRRSVNGMGYA